jgi:integrase
MYLTVEEYQRLLHKLGRGPLQIVASAPVGLRAKEVARLKWADLKSRAKD